MSKQPYKKRLISESDDDDSSDDGRPLAAKGAAATLQSNGSESHSNAVATGTAILHDVGHHNGPDAKVHESFSARSSLSTILSGLHCRISYT